MWEHVRTSGPNMTPIRSCVCACSKLAGCQPISREEVLQDVTVGKGGLSGFRTKGFAR